MKRAQNLTELYEEVAERESLEEEVSIAQLAEVFAILGIRWREMGWFEAIREMEMIFDRAGLLSEHNK